MDRAARLPLALQLYRGELLPGFYQQQFVEEQRNLADLHRMALHDLPRQYEAAGETQKAINAARAAIAADPLAEETHCYLMQLYAAAGQPSAVLQQYQELEEVLRRELEEEPSEATRQLMESLRASGRSVVAAQTPVDHVIRAGPGRSPATLPALPIFYRSSRAPRHLALWAATGSAIGVLAVLASVGSNWTGRDRAAEKAVATSTASRPVEIPLDTPPPSDRWSRIYPHRSMAPRIRSPSPS